MSGSRFQRSSFQGLSIIEGERSTVETVSNTASNDVQLYKQRNERRRRSSSLAQSHQIRDIIAKTVEELSQKGSIGGGSQYETAEDRLKEVLAEVKESGYSAEKIFSFFRDKPAAGNLDDELVSHQSFVKGLRKLGYKWKDENELACITDRFDLNKDGKISLAEFQHYCYHEVPSVAWKAERQRVEKAADVSDNDAVAIDVSRFDDIKEIKYAAGPEVHVTSKLFWKQDVSVNISLRYCNDLDVITIVIQNTESKEEYDTLYVNKSDCVVNQDALEEAATLAVQTSDENTDKGRAVIKENVLWDFYCKYLLARVQLTEVGGSHVPGLAKLHGDEYSTLAIDKPCNLVEPKKRYERKSGDTVREFETKVKSFQRDSRSARTSRQSAQELSSIVESALNEILLEDSM